jgi:hypothetical protein
MSNTTDTRVQPDEVYERGGMPRALFGQEPVQPYGTPVDPIPAVYASGWSGGEIEIAHRDEFERLSLDDAERYALGLLERVRAAVAWQRSQAAMTTLSG